MTDPDRGGRHESPTLSNDETSSGTMRVQPTPAAPEETHTSGFRSRTGALEIEALFFQALASTNLPFLALGTSGVVLFWSSGAEKLFGQRAEDVVGQSLDSALPELELSLRAHRTELRSGKIVTLEVTVRLRTGESLPLSATVAPAVSETGEVIASIVSVSNLGPEIAAMSERRAPQLDAKSAFAHDLNNVLATIETYSAFVAKEPLSARQTEDLTTVRDAVRRGAYLASQWSTPSPDRERGKSRIELNGVMRGADELLRRAVGGGVELAMQMPPTPLYIRAAPGDVEQILLSLALNARDATRGIGTLTISLRNATSGSPSSSPQEPSGSFAVITVTDSGSGMTKELQSRIFEPFFTNKPRGEGNGLGLPVVLQLVKSMGGEIRVDSEPGRGSEFQIFLPLLEGTPAEFEASVEVAENNQKTVLVVEDDAIMRGGLRRMLQAEGYRVLEAADGVEAADVSARHLEPIHVFVSDLMMPRADGRDAFERVRATRPDIRSVFVSGRLDRSRRLPEGAKFVHKPFATSELTAAVASVIDSAPPDAGRLLSPNPVVLIVDDDEQLRGAFTRVIEECDFIAVPAKSGLHALKILAERHVDVVISDHFMPGIDGVRLLELVRARFEHCVRVLFTAYPSSDIVLDAVNRGGVHKVLVKSMHAVAIRDEIERAVLQSDRFRHRAEK